MNITFHNTHIRKRITVANELYTYRFSYIKGRVKGQDKIIYEQSNICLLYARCAHLFQFLCLSLSLLRLLFLFLFLFQRQLCSVACSLTHSLGRSFVRSFILLFILFGYSQRFRFIVLIGFRVLLRTCVCWYNFHFIFMCASHVHKVLIHCAVYTVHEHGYKCEGETENQKKNKYTITNVFSSIFLFVSFRIATFCVAL